VELQHPNKHAHQFRMSFPFHAEKCIGYQRLPGFGVPISLHAISISLYEQYYCLARIDNRHNKNNTIRGVRAGMGIYNKGTGDALKIRPGG
jgi:hypothetical protein